VLGSMANEARRQRKVVADWEEMGAIVTFSDVKVWMPELLDTGYCGRVVIFPGRLHGKSFAEQYFFEVGFVPRCG
jgi:hypothetical protein